MSDRHRRPSAAILTRLALLALATAAAGCYTRPPTIAHVHIGHAVTGVHVTPGHKGYAPPRFAAGRRESRRRRQRRPRRRPWHV